MNYLLFVILIGAIFGIYVYYDRKLAMTKKQLMIASSQYRSIRNEYRSAVSKNQNLNVRFVTPSTQTAITNIKADVFLAPLPDSPKLKTITIKMEVKVLDSAIINNNTWFYVSLPIDSEYNCRGWINQRDFSIIYSNSNDLVTTYKR